MPRNPNALQVKAVRHRWQAQQTGLARPAKAEYHTPAALPGGKRGS